MSALVAFTAVAVTTVSKPATMSRTSWTYEVPTAVGFLSYRPHLDQADRFDLAVRCIRYSEPDTAIERWTSANIPKGLLAGWDLENRLDGVPEDAPDASVDRIHRTDLKKGRLIDLSTLAPHGAGFRSTCLDNRIDVDTRDDGQRFDDFYTTNAGPAERGITVDTIATFRLTLTLGLSEVRRGAEMRADAERDLARWLKTIGDDSGLRLPKIGTSARIEGPSGA
ncbi:hypothetical protein [uncultured Sphingobium sp.]|uniref:hypothetical protein n=1 Tax=uncultured Sphingobium sp. TaxID=316087 RepID=UPI002617AD28|nr:hypothetical protein [uncultured Sphingobium sp.]